MNNKIKLALVFLLSLLSSGIVLLWFHLQVSYHTCIMIFSVFFVIPIFSTHLLKPVLAERYNVDKNYLGIMSGALTNIIPVTVFCFYPLLNIIYPNAEYYFRITGIGISRFGDLLISGYFYITLWIILVILSMIIGIITVNIKNS